ncbi:MAG: GAF domain-containing protein [Anaerolineales bacterium]|nr:GAF domain-containing protein [Anaerolineales bacterium]
MIIYFFSGLAFTGLGLAVFLQLRRGSDFPLYKLLPWLAAFGISSGAGGWVEMFLVGETNPDVIQILEVFRVVLQITSGLLLLIFGWGIFAKITPLPPWSIFIPGIFIVPVAYVITYALSTFITPSPIEIPIDIWTRYLFYLPGSILAGVGFLRQWSVQRQQGYSDVASLMLGAGLAFLFEAFVMGLVVPAAPYGPASYYNYDRVAYNAFASKSMQIQPYGLIAWLDYQRVLEVTGLPIQFWRMLSAIAVTGFVVRGLDVFEAIQRRLVQSLQDERDRAQKTAISAQIAARHTAESWSDALVRISSRIAELEDVDRILLYIVESACPLLTADFIGLALVNEDTTQLMLKYFSSPDRSELVDTLIPIENSLIMGVLIFQSSYRSLAGEMPENLSGIVFNTQNQANSLAAVPLNLDARTVGVLWAARFEHQVFSDTDLIWMECLADQVMIAIKHGLMTAQLQTLSITEERSRIAREMHDGLAQVLGYMNLQVQTLEAFLKQGKLEKLQIKLDQMREAVQAAHADVRENILSLRTTLANETGLIPAIEEYLEEFSFQTKIETHFDNQVGDQLNLASIAEVQLVCILQEALANVRKHAKALNVFVIIKQQSEGDNPCVFLTIKDDGIGFVPARQTRSFGLQTMSERAQSVGGTLLVWSDPGKGSRVECCIPCLHREQLQKTISFLK